jgi:hypothetical protein
MENFGNGDKIHGTLSYSYFKGVLLEEWIDVHLEDLE